ncbi:DGQHR domain-containing protein DpdB [Phenylobacterium montanum]|uniref:DGQHR domain-containing protein n=1 Tax=Phenylobacterium montanum TaxID=2823693 RepID=A0A975G5G0_9CAUL|nr:DGQHR domain-containing protein DpdB [Caulobacter sp. S6]QUD90981.1 DGQHR domain-containing protein [Caulobacter sp. S6]
MTRPRKTTEPVLAVRAVRTVQADKAIYAFFIAGADLLKIAEISRVHRDAEGSLQGFQRKGIKSHVQAITDFLDQGPVLFPNAIILAISPRARFTAARGERPEGDLRVSEAGTLRIPLPLDGSRAAWIVDGQQRSIALSQAKDKTFPVPVVAFVSEELAVHREQFILVNKAKPLDPRLINELLPEVDAFFPRDLSARKIPSLLVHRLQTSPESPFKGLIRRLSEDEAGAVVIDSALIKAIRLSIGGALGALGPLKAHGDTPADVDGMYRILVAYWSAAKAAFPEAWGLPATDSRLMHSAGIEAMSILMDRIMARAAPGADLQAHAYDALSRIAPHCRWTSGRWTELQRDWNEIQNLPRDIKLLSSHLARLDRQYAFAKVA